MRWITALDSRVRHLHASWHGTIKTTEETRKRGNKSPYNCRCSQIPVIADINDTPKENEKFKKQRDKLIKMEKTRPKK